MSRARFFIAGAAALSVTACADAPTQDHRPAMRFDTAPLEFSRNPKMTSKLQHTFTSNEDDLLDVAERIEAETTKTEQTLAAIEELEAEPVEVNEPTPLPVSASIY